MQLFSTLGGSARECGGATQSLDLSLMLSDELLLRVVVQVAFELLGAFVPRG